MSQLLQQSNRGGRETMEVLDTGSSPSTARSSARDRESVDGEEQRTRGSGRSNASDRQQQQQSVGGGNSGASLGGSESMDEDAL